MIGTPKNGKSRTIVIPAFLRERLNDQLLRVSPAADDFVFTTSKGGPLRHSNFRRRVWVPAVGEAGLPGGTRIHDLRHTAVALLIAQGAHPEAIKRQLGHSSIAVTMDIYGHLLPSDAEGLATAMDEVFRASQTDNRRTRSATQ